MKTTRSENSEILPLDQRVAMAAYYRAEKRGFTPGSELDDWLDAEREISSAAKEEGASSI